MGRGAGRSPEGESGLRSGCGDRSLPILANLDDAGKKVPGPEGHLADRAGPAADKTRAPEVAPGPSEISLGRGRSNQPLGGRLRFR